MSSESQTHLAIRAPSDPKADLLRRAPGALNVPPILVQPGVEQLDWDTTISDDTVFPKAHFTSYRYDGHKRRLPQCISHRGYKAAFPENTMVSFRGAVKAGTHALETDVHVTKDEVVVLSHDADLKRCFGRVEKIADCTWDEIKDLKTIQEPHEPMPRLSELLEYLAQPGLEEIWLLLDIKLDNDADTIMRLLGTTVSAATPSNQRAWKERVILGIWAAKYLPLAAKHLPNFPITHIGFSLSYARHFLTVPNVTFNMLFPILVAPGGKKFIRDAREKHHRQVYAWTVNDKDRMEWCIRQKLDGVITDDPAKFLKVCEEYQHEEKTVWMPFSLKACWELLRIWAWVTVAAFLYRKRFRPVASKVVVRKASNL